MMSPPLDLSTTGQPQKVRGTLLVMDSGTNQGVVEGMSWTGTTETGYSRVTRLLSGLWDARRGTYLNRLRQEGTCPWDYLVESPSWQNAQPIAIVGVIDFRVLVATFVVIDRNRL